MEKQSSPLRGSPWSPLLLPKVIFAGLLLVLGIIPSSDGGFRERPQLRVNPAPPMTTPEIPTPRPGHWVQGNTTGAFVWQELTLEEKLDELWPPWGVIDMLGNIWVRWRGGFMLRWVYSKLDEVGYMASLYKLHCSLCRNAYKGQIIYCKYFAKEFANRFKVECPPPKPPK